MALEQLQLHVLELRKLDRQREASSCTLKDWITWFKHWREDTIMSEIHHPPIQNTPSPFRGKEARPSGDNNHRPAVRLERLQ